MITMHKNKLIDIEKNQISITIKKLKSNIKLQQATAILGFVLLTTGLVGFSINPFLGLFTVLGLTVILYASFKKNSIFNGLRELEFNINELEKLMDEEDRYDEIKE